MRIISAEESEETIQPFSDELRLSVGSVCADGVKAYRHLASPLMIVHCCSLNMRLGHTCVKQSPKFTKKLIARVWNGAAFKDEIRWGGTQKLGNFFTGFRRWSARSRSTLQGRLMTSEQSVWKQFLLRKVRICQFKSKYWFDGHDRQCLAVWPKRGMWSLKNSHGLYL